MHFLFKLIILYCTSRISSKTRKYNLIDKIALKSKASTVFDSNVEQFIVINFYRILIKFAD